ncbi:MAG: GtrA family protein [Halioglobus sp.]
MSVSKRRAGSVWLRFFMVGGLTALIHYCFLFVGVSQFGLSSTVASSFGFLVAVIFNYLMHYGWTFAGGVDFQPPPHGHALFRYLIMILCGFIINAIIMFLSVQVLGWNYLLAQAIAYAAVLVWNFILANRWVFSN